MRRGEIWWANLPQPMGSRPVLLLSRDDVYQRRASVTLASISTRIRGIGTEVLLGPEEGLQRPSAVNLDSINTYPKTWLDRRISVLAPHKMAEVERAIHFALALTT